MTEKNLKGKFLTFSIPLILIAHIFVFIPFTIYLGNADEFVTPAWEILRLCLIPGLIIFVLFYILGLICTEKVHHQYIIFIAVIGLLVWFQGSVLVWDYGVFDGRGINWSNNIWRGWMDLGLWLSVILVALIFYRQIEKPIIQLSYVIFILQLVTAIYSGIENSNKLDNSKAELLSSSNVLQEFYKFSSKKNIVHIMLDGFQSDVFEELIAHKVVGKNYRTAFNGFIFYNETLGIFPYTRFAVPAFLSGEIYANNIPKNDFITSVIEGKTILNTANDFGYEIDLASEPYFGALYAKGSHTNSYIIPKNSAIDVKSENATKLLDLTLFRIAPHFIKQYIYNDQRWLLNAKFLGKEYLQHLYFSHTAFLNKLTANMTVERSAPVYKYIHVMNVHNPMVVAPDCSYAGAVAGTTRASLTVQSKCTLDTIAKLFNKMKTLGIYENSLIIMHADHGGWARPYRWNQRIFWSQGQEISPFAASLASPLLAIKLPGESFGELQTSSALVSLTDIPDTISTIMKWGIKFGGRSVLDVNPKEQRQRKFYYYSWQRDAWKTDFTGPIQEFTIKGSHFDTPWHIGKTIFPMSDR